MKISILGLGWLGKPLADSLKIDNQVVNGSTTNASKLAVLKDEGYEAFQIALNENEVIGPIVEFLKDSNILILNTPPGLRRNPESNYVAKVEQLIPYIESSPIKHVLFIGSTSVFADTEKIEEITNQEKPNANTVSGKQLAIVEKTLIDNANFKTTILRFAGLVDERRHPATMISKRKQIPNPLAPVNLIHRGDCIGIIKKIIELKKWDKIYNAAYPLHPNKQVYYTKICVQKSLNTPDFNEANFSKGKLINGKGTAKELAYQYKYSIE